MLRNQLAFSSLFGLGLTLAGCATGESDSTANTRSQQQTAQTAPPAAPAAADKSKNIPDNPTTRAGRGEPDLDSMYAHAAWIYVDGHDGRYIERDGEPQVQWVINAMVSRSPSFRVEAYEPLLGRPTGFQAALQTSESFDGTYIIYAISAKPGTFEVGKDYSLLDPGENFTILNKTTNEQVSSIPLLSAGTYGFVAGVKNIETNQEALAVSYFTVADDSKPETEEPKPSE